MHSLVSCVVLVLLGGCAIGAGPVGGYGLKRGAFYGAEASGGLSVARLGIGWQSNARNLHLRAETTIDRAADGQSSVGPLSSARLGFGYVVSGEGEGVLIAGPALGYLFRDQRCGPESNSTLIGVVSLDVRYIA